jgi:aryl-alcohol dehydrogenase-like predicted oxidoreductase
MDDGRCGPEGIMRYKLFGASGLRVSEICLGTMTFGDDWGWGAGKEESKRIFEAYAEAGGNFLDTANRYTEGTSEKYVGELVASERDHFVIGTKYTLFDRKGDPNMSGNHRKNLVRSLEGSLKRLKTEYVDVLWVHAWDFLTPVDEVMRALDDVVSAGKVLYLGISDTPAWIVSRANTLASLRGWSRFAGLQIKYSLIERTPERDLLPMARALDLAVTPWAPLGAGLLTGKFKGGKRPSGTRLEKSPNITDRNQTVADALVDLSAEYGRPPSQVALNWVRQRPGVIVPIVGARSASQMRENMGCLEFTLSEDQMRHLDGVSEIELGFPHDFLRSEMPKGLVYGGTLDEIDNHRAKGGR